jgi:hypothetical protein
VRLKVLLPLALRERSTVQNAVCSLPSLSMIVTNLPAVAFAIFSLSRSSTL